MTPTPDPTSVDAAALLALADASRRERAASVLDRSYPKIATCIRAGMRGSTLPDDLINPGLLLDLLEAEDRRTAASLPGQGAADALLAIKEIMRGQKDARSGKVFSIISRALSRPVTKSAAAAEGGEKAVAWRWRNRVDDGWALTSSEQWVDWAREKFPDMEIEPLYALSRPATQIAALGEEMAQEARDKAGQQKIADYALDHALGRSSPSALGEEKGR